MGRNAQEKNAIIFNPRCKKWDCPYCGEQNREYWIHQAQRGATILLMEGAQFQFVTLTSRGYSTPASSIYFFSQNWPKLRKRASSQTNGWKPVTGVSWAYFLVPERHKSGVLHAHLIAATHIEGERWWKDNAWASGFGHQVKVKPMIDVSSAIGYVTKYLTKSAGDITWPKDFRRVRHSQNWPIDKEKPLDGWVWETVSEDVCWIEKGALINMGWQVIDKRPDG